MRTRSGTAILLLAPWLAFGQASPRPEFEVAAVRPAQTQTPGQNIGLHIDGAQVRCTNLSLKDYIGMAYRLKFYQIVGPDWLASEKFDISAKLPSDAAASLIPEMLQALLADRFEMKAHRDARDLAVYMLEAAKGGIRMKEAPPVAAAGAVNIAAGGSQAGVGVDLGGGSFFSFGNNRLEGKKLTMAALADTLGRFMDGPVVDGTGLKGAYDLTLELSPEDYQAMMVRSALLVGVLLPPEAVRFAEGNSSASLATALLKVGLTTQPRKAPLEVLVIDHMLKAPGEN